MMVNNIKRKKNKRAAILHAAEKIFVTQGYKKTSVAQIAKEAKASQVTLYKYFPSKIALAREVVIKLITDGYQQSEEYLDNQNKTFV